MNVSLNFAILVMLSATGWAQQRSFDEYEGRPEKYLGKEVTVGCQSAERENPIGTDDDLLGENVFFRVYTMGRAKTSFCYVLVPLAQADSFYRRYSSDATERNYTTRPLRGIFLKFGKLYYLGFNGASLGSGHQQKQ
jgi:hypothetical protein